MAMIIPHAGITTEIGTTAEVTTGTIMHHHVLGVPVIHGVEVASLREGEDEDVAEEQVHQVIVLTALQGL